MELVAIVITIVLFDLAAWRWGVDSTDRFDSREWRYRKEWRGFSRGK